MNNALQVERRDIPDIYLSEEGENCINHVSRCGENLGEITIDACGLVHSVEDEQAV
jgi:hypothetical protein